MPPASGYGPKRGAVARQAAWSGLPATAGAALSSWILALAGCTTHAPLVEVDGAAVRERTDDAVLLDITVRLTNGNTAEVILGEVVYSVAGDDRFSGRRRSQLTLAPLTTEILTLPAVFVTEEGGEIPDLDAIRIDGRIAWRGTADLERALYNSGLYRPRAGFSGTVAPGS